MFAQFVRFFEVDRELGVAYLGLVRLIEGGGIEAVVVRELIGIVRTQYLRGAEHTELAGRAIHQDVIVHIAIDLLVRAVHCVDGGRVDAFQHHWLRVVGVVDGGEIHPLHKGTKCGRRIAAIVGCDFAGETRHASLVIQAAVIEIYQFHLGTSFTGTLHGTLQELCCIAVFTRTSVD